MKNISTTYRFFTKATAILLLMAFLIPTGLQAKQLVDFCLMEMNSHEMATTSSTHDDCDSEPVKEKETDHQHQNCDWGFVCACGIGQSQLGDKEWIPASKSAEVILSETDYLAPFLTTGETIPANQQIRLGEYAPPLWLLYDTFLM